MKQKKHTTKESISRLEKVVSQLYMKIIVLEKQLNELVKPNKEE